MEKRERKERLEGIWFALLPFARFLLGFVLVEGIALFLRPHIGSVPGDTYDLLFLDLAYGAGMLLIVRDVRSELDWMRRRRERILMRWKRRSLFSYSVIGWISTLLLALFLNIAALWFLPAAVPASAGSAAALPFRCASVVLLTPLVEEGMFRAVLCLRLSRALGEWKGIALSALCFALFHGNLVQGVYAFVMGLALARLYTRTGLFSLPVITHAAVNLMVLLMPAEVLLSPAALAGTGLLSLAGFVLAHRLVPKGSGEE